MGLTLQEILTLAGLLVAITTSWANNQAGIAANSAEIAKKADAAELRAEMDKLAIYRRQNEEFRRDVKQYIRSSQSDLRQIKEAVIRLEK